MITGGDRQLSAPPSPKSTADSWVREELLHLLSVSATLSGLSVTVVALLHTLNQGSRTASLADDMFAVCALLFLTCAYLIFSALRTRRPTATRILVRLIDTVFLMGLTLMTIAGFVMVYTVW